MTPRTESTEPGESAEQHRPPSLLAAAVVTVVMIVLTALLGACTTDEPSPDSDGPTQPTPSAASAPPRGPAADACYLLRFQQALAPTSARRAVDCDRPHTSQTFRVGDLRTELDGHLLAVDSDRVQGEVADTCRGELAAFLDGTEEEVSLSMIRPVWFTPSVEQSDEGADWYRCDAVIVAGPSTLVRTTTSLAGILAGDEVDDAVAMCGTAAPDDEDFIRVPCAAEHSWRAIDVVGFAGDDYPGVEAAQEQGQAPCEDAAAATAEDPLDFAWGYEWPTAEQWDQGMTFGRCWAPEPAAS